MCFGLLSRRSSFVSAFGFITVWIFGVVWLLGNWFGGRQKGNAWEVCFFGKQFSSICLYPTQQGGGFSCGGVDMVPEV